MAFAAAGALGGEAAAGGLLGGRMAAGGLFGASEGEAALNIAGSFGSMAPGSKSHGSLSGTQMTPLLGLKSHPYDVSERAQV